MIFNVFLTCKKGNMVRKEQVFVARECFGKKEEHFLLFILDDFVLFSSKTHYQTKIFEARFKKIIRKSNFFVETV